MSRVVILNMDVMAGLALLPDESQHMVITSVPYWGLRDYGIPPSVWGGDPACAHRWHGVLPPRGSRGRTTNDSPNSPKQRSNTGSLYNQRPTDFCVNCGAWDGCLGMEATVQLYVEHIVTVFREVRRVLRRDGTCWLNIGDTYNSSGAGWQGKNGQRAGRRHTQLSIKKNASPGLKQKDMCLVPERVILALQDSGWWVRRDLIWHKEAAMPESVTDRPTTAHEYVWILAKQRRYFYDQWAIAEPVSPDTHPRMGRAHNSYQAPGQDEQRGAVGFRENINNGVGTKSRIPSGWDTGTGNHHGMRGRYTPKQNPSFQAATSSNALMLRNARSVWMINPEPFGLEMCRNCRHIYHTPEFRQLSEVSRKHERVRRCRCGATKWLSHFATFPTALVERCVLAGTSAKGVCPSCFAPWKRIVRKGASLEEWKQACGADAAGGYEGLATKDYAGAGAQDASAVKARILSGMRERVTVGWQPTCKCAPHEPVLNSSVLDPFGGSCTVGLVTSRLQRNSVLIEINEHYCEMGRWRIVRDAPLLADVEIRKEVKHGQETQETETEAGARAGAGVLT